MMRLEHFEATGEVVRFDDYVRTVVLRESVHVLNEDLFLRQVL